MDSWEGWDFQRFYLLFVAAAFVLIGLQVLLFHWRAAFSKLVMYLPVVASPFLAAAGIVAAITREGIVGWIALAIFSLGVLGGAVGVYEHLRGLAGRIGGFTPRNLVAGPPVLLPATYAAVAFSGGLAVIWGGV
jgi:hypothetical protein